jgi:ribosomal-protein-alanine N-acetyltransferase
VISAFVSRLRAFSQGEGKTDPSSDLEMRTGKKALFGASVMARLGHSLPQNLEEARQEAGIANSFKPKFTPHLGAGVEEAPQPPFDKEQPLHGPRVFLRPPTKRDYDQWSSLRRKSADFLRPWEPIWPSDDLTVKGYQRRLTQYRKDSRDGRSLPFFLFARHSGELLGGVNVSNIRRGICQTASIGYWMGAPFAGKGYMSEALLLLLPHLFTHHHLHRIEAACMAHNGPSMAVLGHLGFVREGLARRYLCINGRWEDHILFAALKEDIDPAVSAAHRRWSDGVSQG